jgi:hypothetical protein
MTVTTHWYSDTRKCWLINVTYCSRNQIRGNEKKHGYLKYSCHCSAWGLSQIPPEQKSGTLPTEPACWILKYHKPDFNVYSHSRAIWNIVVWGVSVYASSLRSVSVCLKFEECQCMPQVWGVSVYASSLRSVSVCLKFEECQCMPQVWGVPVYASSLKSVSVCLKFEECQCMPQVWGVPVYASSLRSVSVCLKFEECQCMPQVWGEGQHRRRWNAKYRNSVHLHEFWFSFFVAAVFQKPVVSVYISLASRTNLSVIQSIHVFPASQEELPNVLYPAARKLIFI